MSHPAYSRPFRFCLTLLLLTLIAGSVVALFFLVSQVEVAEAAPQALPVVEFEQTAVTVDEDAGTVSLDVVLSQVYTAVVTLNYKTLPGTASAGSDYSGISSGDLTIQIGDDSGTIAIPIVNDLMYEPLPDEYFYVQLFNATNATIGVDAVAIVSIDDNESAPTATPTSGTPTQYLDSREPNNTLGEASDLAVNATRICSLTLWPSGDQDYYRFVGKPGSSYEIFTSSLTAGLDTELFIYDPQGQLIGQNDDVTTLGDRSSLVHIVADQNGYYYARVINRDPSNPAGKMYCIEVDEVQPFTPTPSQTPVPGADTCEYNSTLDTACVLEVGEANRYSANFIPVFGSLQDTDVYKVWMRQGTFYTCETFVGPYADTNMIFLKNNGQDFQPNLGNNDKAPGDYGSELSLLAPYTGWLYVIVGPIVAPPYEESDLHTYEIQCLASVATPTPTATETPLPVVVPPGTGGGATATPGVSPTPFLFPTFPPTPTPIDLSVLTPPATPTPPLIQVQPLPTATPAGGGQQNVAINVTVYYDTNFNFLPEINEGIMDVAVALYDNGSGALIAFGSTSQAGSVSFAGLTAAGPVRVVVPFLNYSQVVIGGSSTILVRVAPQPLPIGIP